MWGINSKQITDAYRTHCVTLDGGKVVPPQHHQHQTLLACKLTPSKLRFALRYISLTYIHIHIFILLH